VPILTAALSLLLAAPAPAADSKFSGSSVSLRHALNARGLDRSADLTWNPYAAAILSLSPSYKLPAELSLSANIDFSGEYTRRDTEISRLNFGDPTLTLSRSFSHKPSGLALDSSATLRFGLSPASRAATRYGAATLGLGLGRSIKELKDVKVRVGFSATTYGNRSTHGVLGQALYSGCSGSLALDSVASACAEEMLIGNGSANAYGALSSNLSATLKLPKTLSVRARFGASWMATYAADLVDERISFDGPSGTKTRFFLMSDLRLAAAPIKRLGLAFGLQTGHPQLATDGQYRSPFFNRYSNLYFDLTLRF
jgi:hypothetical protein